jgi:hypothetical protein
MSTRTSKKATRRFFIFIPPSKPDDPEVKLPQTEPIISEKRDEQRKKRLHF